MATRALAALPDEFKRALGPIVVRHSPAEALRVVIAVAGTGLAIYLAINAYS